MSLTAISKNLFIYITVFAAGMILTMALHEIGPGQKEMASFKRQWGETGQAVDALAEAVVEWSREDGRDHLPEDISVLLPKLSTKAKGVMYLRADDVKNSTAYVALPLLTSPTRAPVPGYTYVEIRRPIAKSLPPGYMTHGSRIASWQAFHQMLAGQKWTVQVVP